MPSRLVIAHVKNPVVKLDMSATTLSTGFVETQSGVHLNTVLRSCRPHARVLRKSSQPLSAVILAVNHALVYTYIDHGLQQTGGPNVARVSSHPSEILR
jgi:hypothetical protein